MDPLFEAEARRASWVRALLVLISLPDRDLALTDGGFVAFKPPEQSTPLLFLAEDPVYGALDSVGGVGSGTQNQTTRVDIGILPKGPAAAAALGSPLIQGSRVRVWSGAVSPVTGGLIGAPTLRFDGEVDKPKFSVGQTWALTLECGTQAERQLEPNADWRLNHARQSQMWPGDNGLAQVSGVISATRTMEWRT